MKKFNKKATQMLTEQTIFLVLNILFFIALLFFVWRAVSDASAVEETTAKKLALILDGMKPGMEVNLTMTELYNIMEKNKFSEFPVHIENNIITVKAAVGNGYSFKFFSNLAPVISIDKNDPNKLLTIKT